MVIAAAAILPLTACADDGPIAPDQELAPSAQLALLPAEAQYNKALSQLRRATARYHDVNAAVADGYVLLHECEERPGEGPVGILYVHFDRLLDGLIDPAKPDALLYEPGRNGKLTLTAAELAIPYALWTGAEPPEFLGASFQPEDEFGVFALHIWIWRHNPDGMFALTNPRVSCAGDS
jgi:hypothetical protein